MPSNPERHTVERLECAVLALSVRVCRCLASYLALRKVYESPCEVPDEHDFLPVCGSATL